MMKRLLFLLSLIVLFSVCTYSQWTNQGRFPAGADTLFGTSGGHGVAVDPDGKVWIVPYRPFKTDSVFVPDSNKYFNARPVHVYNPDGTPASFSPIKLIHTPERKNKVFEWSKTGITTDKNGNILVNDFDELVLLNYKTGAGMHWAGLTVSGGSSLTKPATDTLGNIYVAYTLGGNPILVLDSTLAKVGNAVDTLKEIGRTIDVSKDGSTIYAHRYTIYATLVYHRGSEFEPYVITDTTLRGFQTEASNFNPVNGLLYVSSGSYNNKPQTDTVANKNLFYPKATIGTFYGVNVKSTPWKVVDSLKWNFTTAGSVDERPRGIAFTKDGKTAYITAFGQSYYPIVQKLTTTTLPSDVKRENNLTVESYRLEQNYPNPFNPSTEIKFSVAKDGFVSLKVYDILGKEVATLVNETMRSGNYSTRFNAQNLSSGIYIYQLQSNGVILSHKMTLLK